MIPPAPTVALPPDCYDADSPEISIVILNYNKPDLTRTCLEHIWAHTTDHRYEIIVVDNGSDPENVAPLHDIDGPFRLLRLELNRFFGEGNNIGVEAALGRYILFLNNDAFVTPDWLDPMVQRMEQEPLLGGVGPRFFYADGRQQESGSFIASDGDAVQVGKFGAYLPEDMEQDHMVDYVSTACFLIRRDLFLSVGGFEYVYEPAYYEDVDLCLKIAARGLFIGYCAASRVMHIENATSSPNRERLGLHDIIDINKIRFLKLWGERLALRDDAATAEAPPPLGGRLGRRPHAVFYTPFDITPGGGERYLLTAAAALLADYDVHLVTEELYSRTRIRAIGRDLSLDLHGLELIERRSLGRLGPIDLSVMMSNEALPPHPGFAPRNLYVCQFPFPQHWSEDTRRRGNLDSFAGSIVYSEFVRGCLLTKREGLGATGYPVKIIAPPVPLAPAGLVPAPLTPPWRIVLVGRFFAGGHNKRHDVAIEAVRRLVAAGVPVQLDLIGGLPSHSVHRQHYMRLLALAEGLPVWFHPNATPATLSEVLSRGHLYLHAAGHEVDVAQNAHECEHFGISVLEAMSHGLVPFVVANGGPVGFVRDGVTGHTYANLDELIAKLTAALAAPATLAAMRAAAPAVAAQYDEAAFVQAWRAAPGDFFDIGAGMPMNGMREEFA